MAENDTMPADGGIGNDAAPAPEVAQDADPFEGVVDLDALTDDDDASAVDDAASDDEAETDGELDDPDEDAEGDDEADAEPEEVKIHFGGREIALDPKASVKDAGEQIQTYLNEAWAANTRRSMEVSELRKSAESTLAQAEKVQSMSDEAFTAFVSARSAEAQARALQQQLSQIDPDQDMDRYRILSDRLAMTKQQYNAAAQQTAQIEQAEQQQRAQITQQRHQEGVAQIKKQVRNFDEEAVLSYAHERFGIDKDQARSVYGTNPAAAIAMWESMQWRNAQNRAKAKPAKAPGAPIKGGVRPSAAPASTSDPAAMNDDQFAKYLGLR